MARHASNQPTEVEMQILRVLWQRGRGTVREVHRALTAGDGGRRDTGYSTTLKMMQVMLEKGLLVRDDSVRPQVYRSADSAEKTQLQLLDHLVRSAFGGSVMKLVMRAVTAKRVSPSELAKVQELIAEAETEQKEQTERERRRGNEGRREGA